MSNTSTSDWRPATPPLPRRDRKSRAPLALWQLLLRQAEAPHGDREERRRPGQLDAKGGQHVGDVEPAHDDAAQTIEDPGSGQQMADEAKVRPRDLEREPGARQRRDAHRHDHRGGHHRLLAAALTSEQAMVATTVIVSMSVAASSSPSVEATSESATIIRRSAAG